MDKRKNRMS